MSKYNKLIKENHLKTILLKETSCEEKLDEIRESIGLPPATTENEGAAENAAEAANSSEATETDNLRNDSVSRIVEDLQGREKTLAKQILNEIEKSQLISWDYANLELIIDGKNILHSNIKLLIEKIVHVSSAVIPFGYIQFLDALLYIKLPINYMKDADSLNIREALINIHSRKNGQVTQVPTENIPQPSSAPVIKRERPDTDDDNEEVANKRPKATEETVEEANEQAAEEPLENSDTETTGGRKILKAVRRSERNKLKKNISETWQPFKNA